MNTSNNGTINLFYGTEAKCRFWNKFLDFEEIFVKKFFAYVEYRPKIFVENLPKYGYLDESGIWRQSLYIRGNKISRFLISVFSLNPPHFDNSFKSLFLS